LKFGGFLGSNTGSICFGPSLRVRPERHEHVPHERVPIERSRVCDSVLVYEPSLVVEKNLSLACKPPVRRPNHIDHMRHLWGQSYPAANGLLNGRRDHFGLGGQSAFRLHDGLGEVAEAFSLLEPTWIGRAHRCDDEFRHSRENAVERFLNQVFRLFVHVRL
jgi:hypothetical protein